MLLRAPGTADPRVHRLHGRALRRRHARPGSPWRPAGFPTPGTPGRRRPTACPAAWTSWPRAGGSRHDAGQAAAGQPGTGPGAPLLGVWRQGVRRTLAHFRAVPFTLAVLAVFLVTGAATGSFLSGPPEALLHVASVSAPGLKAGHWWSLFTSLFFATNLLAYLAASLMILLLLGLAERQLGTLRTAVFFFAGQFAAVTLFLLVTQLARYAGDGWLGLMVGRPADRPVRRRPRRRPGGQRAAADAVAAAAADRRASPRRCCWCSTWGMPETVVGLAGALAGLAAGWWIQGDTGHPAPPPLNRPRNPQPAGPHGGDLRGGTDPHGRGQQPHRAAGPAARRRPEPAAHAGPAGAELRRHGGRQLPGGRPRRASPVRWASRWRWSRWCCC